MNKKIICCADLNTHLLKAGKLYRIHGSEGEFPPAMYLGRIDGIMRRPLFMFYRNGKFYSSYFEYNTKFEEIDYNKKG